MANHFYSFVVYVIASLFVIMCSLHDSVADGSFSRTKGLVKLEYNNPGLLVDLDVGFKSIPMPMDFDGDGDYDLLVSESGSYAESGVFYFENISGNDEMPIFRHSMQVSSDRFRLGYDGSQFEVSTVGDRVHVLTPDRVSQKLLIYKDVPQNVFWDQNEIELSPGGYHRLHSIKTRWKMIDLDGDKIEDLVCSADELLFLKNIGTREEPNYANPVVIPTITGNSIRDAVKIRVLFDDYDGDGDYDYIGTKNARFYYFENVGTPQQYAFADAKPITYAGTPIMTVSRSTVRPSAIDWDKDGNIDIVTGDEDGKVSLIKNTGKIVNGVPEFLPPRFFQQEARFVDFGALSAPRVVDWDGDGLTDIVSGNGVGHIGFIKNLGGYPPKWDAPKLLEVDGDSIRIIPPGARWGYTTIDVADWNHNGLLDVLVNDHHGHVQWFENVGSRTSPKLLAPKPIEVQWKGEPLKPDWVPGETSGNDLLAPWRTSPYVMDFDEDGLNDLVMLDYEGYLAVYLRYRGSDDELLLSPPQRSFVFPSGEPVRLNQLLAKSSGRLKIGFSDWDGDGMRDLVFSSKPAVDWMRNIGMTDGQMVLQYMGRVLSKTLMGHTDGPVTADWNHDGIPDLLVGTETGVFYYWERPSFDTTTTMTTSGKQKPAKYPYFKR